MIENTVDYDYRSHRVFQNQPSYKVFNKPFGDSFDSLFLYLNGIDPKIYEEELNKKENIGYNLTVDPRTNQRISQILVDHTRTVNTRSFHSDQKSTLRRYERHACFQVLHDWQNGRPVQQEVFMNFQKCLTRKKEENKRFQQFVYEYAQRENDFIYEPMKKFVELYRRCYSQIYMPRLLLEQPNLYFTTHLGFPQVRKCTTINNQTAVIKDLTFVSRTGYAMLWKYESKEIKHLFANIYHKLETLFEMHETAPANIQPKLNVDYSNMDTFILPIESLLFLLTCGEYIDLPTEMWIEVNKDPKRGYKRVHFQMPLPARNCGWHINSQVVEKAYATYVAMPGIAQWFKLNGKMALPVYDLEAPELNCMETDSSSKYQLHEFDETSAKNPRQTKANEALVSWRLQCTESAITYMLHTKLQIPAILDEKAEKILGCHLIKLEYKPRHGCEIMTKFELIKAWLQIKLLKADFGVCSRLSIKKFEVLLEQNRLTLEYLEEQLLEHYHVEMPLLLGQLCEFLKLLLHVHCGKYLLRYNSKYKDKILLCESSKEQSMNSVQLHSLIQTLPSDFSFMMQNSYLPISEDLCSSMHEAERLPPCIFPGSKKLEKSKTPAISKTTKFTPQMERQILLSKISLNKDKEYKRRRKIVKQTKSKKRRTRIRKLKAEELKEEKELEKDMELDRLLGI